MGAEALARLEGVSLSYGEVHAVRDLTFEVRRGEVLGLLGPNGAGKTTAVRILCGLLPPTAGRASVGGFDVATAPLEARRRVGFVPDGAPLYANLSARAHLHLVGRLHGWPEEQLTAEATRLLDAFGLGARAGDAVGQFSHGMRQKTALACALLPKPDLLVLDEPLTGLDAPTAAVVKECLRGWADRGGAVLYTSHLLDVVERVCDRMLVLREGREIAQGTLDELRARASQAGAGKTEPGGAGGETLESVFRTLTASDDPAETARRILG